MSTNVNMLKETNETPTSGQQAGGQQAGGTSRFNNVTSKVSDLVHTGTNTLRGQIDTVREHGVDGIRRDVTDYAKKEPLKALLLAGGIGALAALIIRRR
jgi:ElaB/YqjD/DUF883 family membrane-anchored ribosome-binding protein